MRNRTNSWEVLKSIIESDNQGYVSDSFLIKSPYTTRILVIFTLLTLLFFTLCLYTNAFPIGIYKFFNITLPGYSHGSAKVLYEDYRRYVQNLKGGTYRCGYTAEVLSDEEALQIMPKQIHIKEISCSAFMDYEIKFIYNRENPSILYVYDFTGKHRRRMLLMLVFVVLSVITAILFFEMFKSSFDYHRKYQQTMKYAKPLYVHLQNQTSLLSDEGELFELPLVLLSDTGKIRSFLGLLFNLKRRLEHIRVETDDSGLMVLRFDDKLSFMKKCYIYGITESKLREAAELQNFTDDKVKSQGLTSDIKTSQSPVALIDGFQSSDECDGTQATNKNNATTLTNKSDRVIYFAGPWIYSTRKPAKTLKLYITGNEIKDYFIV